MRNVIVIINICIVFVIVTIFSETEKSVRLEPSSGQEVKAELIDFKIPTNTSSIRVEKRYSVNEAYVKDFIYQISEARIMNREEGKLASQRGTSRALKDYGALMVADQTRMLEDLTEIARSKQLEVASILGKNKTEGLSELQKLHGKNFDSRFIKMMIIDHKRDMRKLEKATTSSDPDIMVFATKYLPVVKSHLKNLKSLKDAR